MFTKLRRALNGNVPTGNLDPYTAELAAALMAHRSVGLGLHLSRAEAGMVASFMCLKRASAGTAIARAGGEDNGGQDALSTMLLVQGTATVEGAPIDAYAAEVLDVINPGAFLNKARIFDGLPHATTCVDRKSVV